MRRIWQKGLIALARSRTIKSFMQGNRSTTTLARRYVGGANSIEAIDQAEHLARQGIKVSLFYLGEYVDRYDLVEENITALNHLITLLENTSIDRHISVDPTQVGCSIDWNAGAGAFWPLAHALKRVTGTQKGQHCLMIDMEDDSVVQHTIDLHDGLVADDYPVGITLQAYLKRTEADLDTIIKRGGKVRLVKGAFVGSPNIAYVGEKAIKENYYRLTDRMLSVSAREAGFYPVFGTHDHQLHAHIIAAAKRNGWPRGSYEIEMLYGARNDVARQLAQMGEAVRLYLPFGSDWWPYAARRIGENPGNVMLLLRSLL